MNSKLLVLFLATSCVVALPLVDEDVEERLDNIDERGPYIEGDMIFKDTGVEGKAGVKDTRYRWPSNTVVYRFGSTFSSADRQTITDAMNEISSKTCIKFRTRSGTEKDYVNVINSKQGCYSYIGRVGGAQELNLANGCVQKGVVAHEFIHAIGFVHEQSRTDRDDFVTINYDNIQGGKNNSNFDKYDSQTIDPFGVTYDYGSVMHYSAYAFAKNTKERTIIVKQEGARIGQRDGLSAKDAQKIKNMYKCA